MKKDIIALVISLLLTIIFLDVVKLPPLIGFIAGTIIWSILHYNLKKIL